MAMMSKALKGLGKGALKIGKALTTVNNIADGGGLSSLIIRRKVNGAGAALILGGQFVIGMGNEGFKSGNKARLGRVSYGGGMARMTNSYTSGGIEAMHQVAKGNYASFADIAEEAVTSTNIAGKIEDYGATPEFISALYNMGGR